MKTTLKQVWSNDVRLPKVLGLTNKLGDWCYRWKAVKVSEYLEEESKPILSRNKKSIPDCYQAGGGVHTVQKSD